MLSDKSSTSLEDIISNCLEQFPDIKSLKKEQQLCLLNLAKGKDVFAILPTGFGKSLIFQLFPKIMKSLFGTTTTIIVVTPLVAIMKDQVDHLKSIGVSAAAIAIGVNEGDDDVDEQAVKDGCCEVVYGSPESWLSKEWKKELKDGKLGQHVVAIAFDEVHSITEWGFPQKEKKKMKSDPFREAFARVKDLRSLLPGKPVIALTATIQIQERRKIIKACGILLKGKGKGNYGKGKTTQRGNPKHIPQPIGGRHLASSHPHDTTLTPTPLLNPWHLPTQPPNPSPDHLL